MTQPMTQTAPYPDELADLVEHAELWPGWHVWLEDMLRDPASSHGAEGRGLTLVIQTKGFDTYHPERGQDYRVRHYFIVPAATYNRRSWRRWLFDQYAKVWLHEAMESFAVGGERPFAPHHGPGNDPYTVFEHGTDEDVRTRFTGDLNE
jgi:hypothetical protein